MSSITWLGNDLGYKVELLIQREKVLLTFVSFTQVSLCQIFCWISDSQYNMLQLGVVELAKVAVACNATVAHVRNSRQLERDADTSTRSLQSIEVKVSNNKPFSKYTSQFEYELKPYQWEKISNIQLACDLLAQILVSVFI